MAYDEDIKGQGNNKSGEESGHESGKDRLEKPNNLGDFSEHREHKGGFIKGEEWITRPTTSETPTQTPSTLDGGKDA